MTSRYSPPPERNEWLGTVNDSQSVSTETISREDRTASLVGTVDTPTDNDDALSGFEVTGEATFEDGKKSNTTVRRKLRTIQLFMIKINGTFGAGLYARSGQILELGGPVAIIMSFVIIGVLSWAVMQCITELLCIWHVPGALPLFVTQFVDEELGVAVSVVYWFGYSISFAALISAAAATLNYWTNDIKGFTGFNIGVIYIAIPILLCAINTAEIGIYGWFEVFAGSIKIGFLMSIIVTLVIIQSRSKISEEAALNWVGDLKYDTDAAFGWSSALMMSLSIAAFPYAGVEIIAASVIEARWSVPNDSPSLRTSSEACTGNSTTHLNANRDILLQERTVRKTIGSITKLSAVFVPLVVTAAYTVSGLLVSLNFERKDCELPRLSWIKNEECPAMSNTDSTTSPFVIFATRSKVPGLDTAFNSFILFTILTCANTNLYVGSRTLFGLGRNARRKDFTAKCVRWFEKTNRNRVPIRALVFSALSFCWVPFLQPEDGFGGEAAMVQLVEILGQMGTVSVLIVWTCQCLAYIRYYHAHGQTLERSGILCGQYRKDDFPNYPYRSHWQPPLAYLALGGCLLVVVVCNGAYRWREFHCFPFCFSYLTPILFLGLWVGLKLKRKASISWVDLNAEALKGIIEFLDELRAGSFESPPDETRARVRRPWGAEQSLWTSLGRILGLKRE